MSSASAPLPNPAPWVAVVPGMAPVTVDDLLTIPDDGYIYEAIDGVLVRMAGSGRRASSIATIIGALLFNFVFPRRLGIVTGADGVYKFPGAETGLIPNVAFYRAERDASILDKDKPIPFAPDLAVEVASPDQQAAEMAAKARLYLGGGTRLVWVVWPPAGISMSGTPTILLDRQLRSTRATPLMAKMSCLVLPIQQRRCWQILLLDERAMGVPALCWPIPMSVQMWRAGNSTWRCRDLAGSGTAQVEEQV